MSPTRLRAVLLAGVVVSASAALAGAVLPRRAAQPRPILVGAVFPLDGVAGSLPEQEALGVRIAAELVNADGGVGGRPISLDVRTLQRAQDAPAVMARLRRDGAQVVIGAYSSDLSIAASAAAAKAGLVYWEAGAVADRLTGRGLPMVFRVGASGTNLGSNSAAFATAELAPRLGKGAGGLRLAIVAADDDYATSVADAAAREARCRRRAHRAARDLQPHPAPMAADHGRLAAARPDVIILASHIPDGVAFRRAMLAARLKVGALIGSTMAECDPDFAGDLGAGRGRRLRLGSSDGGFQPSVLSGAARATYQRLAQTWRGEGRSQAGLLAGGRVRVQKGPERGVPPSRDRC